jgi:hypothetical protein
MEMRIMVDLILFPSSYFSIKRVDEDLQSEYDAVMETGLFEVVLFGYDKWVNEEVLVLNEKPNEMRKAIMRGWMMKSELYEKSYDRLLDNNIELVTNPTDYRQMHIFPNAYKLFGTDTASMNIYPLHEQINVDELKAQFERFMVKDFVKSVKGTDFPRYFDGTITQEEFDKWMQVFYHYRGSLLTGGICIKEFLDLKFYGERPNEYRVFYSCNEVVSVCRNSGQPSYTVEPPKELIEKYKNLPSCYYTVDFAELTDGTWKIIEAGDGSVSGLSENQNAGQYFRALYHVWSK